MDDKIYIATLVYKNIVDKTEKTRHLSYKVLGPMLGTIENKVFINTHDRVYTSIEEAKTNMDDSIRYAYYNKISLKEAKDKYKSDNLEEIIKLYKDEYIKDSYFVIDTYNESPIIIRYDEKKMRRKYESDIATPL